MMIWEINVVAVVAATVWSAIVGFIGYGLLFMKPWAKYTGVDANDTTGMWGKMMKEQFWNIIGITAFYYILKQIAIIDSINISLFTLIWIFWLAFMVPPIMSSNIWEKKHCNLWFINMFGSLAYIMAAWIVLSYWL